MGDLIPPLTGRGITVGSNCGAPAGMPTWIHDVDGVDSVDRGVMDGAWANVRPGGISCRLLVNRPPKKKYFF